MVGVHARVGITFVFSCSYFVRGIQFDNRSETGFDGYASGRLYAKADVVKDKFVGPISTCRVSLLVPMVTVCTYAAQSIHCIFHLQGNPTRDMRLRSRLSRLVSREQVGGKG